MTREEILRKIAVIEQKQDVKKEDARVLINVVETLLDKLQKLYFASNNLAAAIYSLPCPDFCIDELVELEKALEQTMLLVKSD